MKKTKLALGILLLFFALPLAYLYITDALNPFPHQETLNEHLLVGKVTKLAKVMRLPDDAIICIVSTYDTELGSVIPGSEPIDAYLRNGGFFWPADGELALVMTSPSERVETRTYHWSYREGYDSPMPEGFTSAECATAKEASLYKVNDRENVAPIFGAYTD